MELLKNKFFLLTAFIDIVLIVSIIYLMGYVQYLIDKDVRINLTEVVTQNKDAIASKLTLELNNIELSSKQITERISLAGNSGDVTIRKIFLEYAKEKNDPTLIWADKDGNALSGEGIELNVVGRRYFILGMQGISNISERVVSRLNGEDIFVICAPVVYKSQIIGTVQKQYSPQEMYDICTISLFSAQGSTYVINSEGYILVFSQQDQYHKESDNFYRIVYSSDPEASKRLESDIKSARSGFLEATIEGKEVFAAYTPIDQVYDWFLISSVNNKAVSPNSEVVITMFYFALFGVVLVFTFSMFSYMTQKRKERENLERIAFIDTVTNGDTQTKFMVELQKILKNDHSKTYYICAFDIDNFKFINSFYGFEVGDKILCEILWLYNDKLLPGELIARVHSDNFIMLLEDVSEERLKVLISGEMQFGDIVVYVSTGIYKVSDRTESLNLMLDKASLAAQKVKGVRHANLGFYSDEFDKELVSNEQIKRSIEKALEDDEIIPFFQPKVNLYTRDVVGAEALARWRKKDGTMVSPAAFVPVCERSGLITLVDMAIFEKTLKFIRKNIDAGVLCVPISVNFSRQHFLNDAFLPTLLGKLEKYNVPPEYVELEVTETIIFDNSDMIREFIDKLHFHGLKISMDDFGTGYSSLHMLKDIEIDVLKIDRAFLLDTVNPERQKAVFSTIVDLAKKLKIKVVVEGVETEENLALAKEFGCTIIQGYYFGKPMEEKEFEKYYTEGKI